MSFPDDTMQCWMDGGIVSFFGLSGTVTPEWIQPTDGSPAFQSPFRLIGGRPNSGGASIRPAMWKAYELGLEAFGEHVGGIVLSPHQAIVLALEGNIGPDHFNQRVEIPGCVSFPGVDIRPDPKYVPLFPEPVLLTVHVIPDPDIKVGIADQYGNLIAVLDYVEFEPILVLR